MRGFLNRGKIPTTDFMISVTLTQGCQLDIENQGEKTIIDNANLKQCLQIADKAKLKMR